MNILTSLLRSFGVKKKGSHQYPGTWAPMAGSGDGVNGGNLLESKRHVDVIADLSTPR